MRYFIDANFIIDVYQRNNEGSINKLQSVLRNRDEIFYNGLVYTETLRIVLDENLFLKLKSAFEYFNWVEINKTIFIDAKKFSRYCRSQDIKVTKGRCEVIDIIHFITAKHYQLELLSNDGDMEKLEAAYQNWLNSQTTQ